MKLPWVVFLFLALAPLVAVTPFSLSAQEREEGDAAEETERLESNRVALFLGGATNTSIEQTGFAFGADYERRLSELWGVGLLAELTVGGDRPRDLVLGVPVSLHAVRGLRLVVAPGLEFKPGGGEEEAESEEDAPEFLLRLGASYEFEVGRYSIAPEFDVDIVNFDEIILVYGLAFGIGF